jgi:hypothetical protein
LLVRMRDDAGAMRVHRHDVPAARAEHSEHQNDGSARRPAIDGIHPRWRFSIRPTSSFFDGTAQNLACEHYIFVGQHVIDYIIVDSLRQSPR